MYNDYQTPPSAPVPPTYYPPVGYSTSARTNGLAVTSMILGILSLFFWSALLSVPAIVLGICSRRGDERLFRMAVTGILCGAAGSVLCVLGSIATVNQFIQEFFLPYGE